MAAATRHERARGKGARPSRKKPPDKRPSRPVRLAKKTNPATALAARRAGGGAGPAGSSGGKTPAGDRRTFEPSERVIGDLPLYLQLQRIGGSLTPIQVSQILRSADNGQTYLLVDLTNELRQKDCHLQGILEAFECAVADLEWQIDPPENATATEAEAAATITSWLRAVPTLPDLFSHLAGGFVAGYAVAEALLAKSGRYLAPTGFVLESARRFCFELTRGRLQWWDQGGAGPSGTYPGVDFQAEWPGRFLVFQPRVVGDVQCREGLARPLMWAALFRNWDVRDWLSLAELSWKPWRHAEYDNEAEEEAIRDLESAIVNMTSSRVAVVPAGTNLKVEWPHGLGPSGSPHAEFFDVMGREMSKCVLGTTTTVELGKHGNQSASQTGERVETRKMSARARKIAVCMSEFVRQLTRINWGDAVRAGAFQFDTEDETDLLQFGQGVAALVDAGLRSIPAKWVHDQAGIPTPPRKPGELSDSDDYTLAKPAGPSAVPGGDAPPPGAEGVP